MIDYLLMRGEPAKLTVYQNDSFDRYTFSENRQVSMYIVPVLRPLRHKICTFSSFKVYVLAILVGILFIISVLN